MHTWNAVFPRQWVQHTVGRAAYKVWGGADVLGFVLRDSAKGRDMNTLILLAVLHGYVSIPPIHVFQPYPDVKCPRGYSVWWPQGKEFENDKYAECIKPIGKRSAKTVTDVSLRRKEVGKQQSRGNATDLSRGRN